MAVSARVCALARDPLYLQVCEVLTRQIASGVWKPNTTLPNELELARELGVSTGTVRKALERLEADKLVLRRQGRGTFVVDQTTPEAASRFERLRHGDGDHICWRATLLEQGSGGATPSEQRLLRIRPDEPVIRKRRLLSTPSRPFAVEEACMAISRLPGLQADGVGDWCLTALAQRHGVHLARACEEVRVLAAPEEVATLLSILPGTMLMRLDRVTTAVDEAPIEWRRAFCHVQDEYYLAETG